MFHAGKPPGLRLLSSSGVVHLHTESADMLVHGFLCVLALVCVSVRPHRLSADSFVSVLACFRCESVCAGLHSWMYLDLCVGEYLRMLVRERAWWAFVCCMFQLSISEFA